MTIIGINGSPRKNWNTATLLTNALECGKSKELDKTGILNPASMVQKLDAFRGDHYRLMNKTLELIVNKAMFDGGEDATACAFGKWKAMLKVENPIIQKALQDITQAHDAFHHSVKTVKDLIKLEKTE